MKLLKGCSDSVAAKESKMIWGISKGDILVGFDSDSGRFSGPVGGGEDPSDEEEEGAVVLGPGDPVMEVVGVPGVESSREENELELLSASAIVTEDRGPRAVAKGDERFKVSQDADWANNRRLWVSVAGRKTQLG